MPSRGSSPYNLASPDAGIAQTVEQRIRNAKVGGSIPLSGTNKFQTKSPVLVTGLFVFADRALLCAIVPKTRRWARHCADQEAGAKGVVSSDSTALLRHACAFATIARLTGTSTKEQPGAPRAGCFAPATAVWGQPGRENKANRTAAASRDCWRRQDPHARSAAGSPRCMQQWLAQVPTRTTGSCRAFDGNLTSIPVDSLFHRNLSRT